MKNLENLPIEKRLKLMEAAKQLNQTCYEIKDKLGEETTSRDRITFFPGISQEWQLVECGC
ncbi:MAG: hypothetical protein SWJ54_07910 [Cyanobacteriota bacterium]|nr:hypothetical protein [Cyanobacteriota bacterium]